MQDPIIDPFDPNYTKKQEAIALNNQARAQYATALANFNLQSVVWSQNAQHYYDHGQQLPETPNPPALDIYTFNEQTAKIDKSTWVDPALKSPTFTPTLPNGTVTIKALGGSDPAETRHQQMLAALKVISDKLDKLLAGGK